MIPLLLALAGLVVLGAGLLVLRGVGPGLRIGRIIASTPRIPVAQARALATDGARPRYVGVHGRIDADDEFTDDAGRPLVIRRRRLQAQRGRVWVTFDDQRQAVAFRIDEGTDSIGVDGDVLGDGLVVVRRESVGTAADLESLPDGLAPTTPVRLLVEQLSSVEHASVFGVPFVDEAGEVVLTSGLGRPLIATTLELPEALRLLGGGRTGPARLASVLLVAGLALLVLAALIAVGSAVAGIVAPPAALAAEPTPTPTVGTDPRSPGQGAGLVGEPLLAIGLVLGIGLLVTLATLAYVRITGGPAGRVPRTPDGDRPITRR